MTSIIFPLSLTRRVSMVTPGMGVRGRLGLVGACCWLTDEETLIELVRTDA